ncbi:15265_t:CDS:2 [Funneliformis caledonium]|uniref:15265_t:CDS:1 n=1 Tax=Funneliformis caledonium TaxID=1117310 RepID=A0A9N9NGJ9_9GLOM|nr:15265_t:CDS:2 [Funneliformis caledonium]
MKLAPIFAITLAFVATAQAAPAMLSKRCFGQEHTPKAEATLQDIEDIAQGTGKEEQAENLSGAMFRALLANAPTCDQQDIAKTYRQLERNIPIAGQRSLLCNKHPRYIEIFGLVQAQDPTGKSKAKDPEDDK